MKKPWKVSFTEERDFTTDEVPGANGSARGTADEKLMKMLRDLRQQVARKQNLPPYVIFQDPSLTR